MNVITVASRKGGAGKTTLTAHLAAFAHSQRRRCLVIDADPQGSLALWHVRRADQAAPAVAQSRADLEQHSIPVWSGQISQRAAFALSLAAGASAGEADARSLAAAEIARLWTAVERSVEAINAARSGAGGTAGRA